MSLRIIKQGSARTAAVQPFFFTEGRVEHQPEPYILPEVGAAEEMCQVSEQAESAVAEAPPPAIDVEQLENDAFERGRAAGVDEGLKAGEADAAARIEEMTRRYSDALVKLGAFKNTLRAQVEEEVVHLALTVAKKLVQREISIDPTIIQTLVRVALERVSEKTAVTIRLCPSDYEYMTNNHSDLARNEGREVRFESDSTLAQGDCMIQSETGDIDARIAEEFNEVESAFFEGT